MGVWRGLTACAWTYAAMWSINRANAECIDDKVQYAPVDVGIARYVAPLCHVTYDTDGRAGLGVGSLGHNPVTGA